MQDSFLLLLLFHFSSCLLNNSFVEVLSVYFGFSCKFLPHCNLLIEYLFNLLDLVILSLNLLAFLFLMETLTKLLNLSPLVVTNVRWKIFYSHCPLTWQSQVTLLFSIEIIASLPLEAPLHVLVWIPIDCRPRVF